MQIYLLKRLTVTYIKWEYPELHKYFSLFTISVETPWFKNKYRMNIPHDFLVNLNHLECTGRWDRAEMNCPHPPELSDFTICGFYKCKISWKGKKQVSKKKGKNFFFVLQNTVEQPKYIKYCKKKWNGYIFYGKRCLVAGFFWGVFFLFWL